MKGKLIIGEDTKDVCINYNMKYKDLTVDCRDFARELLFTKMVKPEYEKKYKVNSKKYMKKDIDELSRMLKTPIEVFYKVSHLHLSYSTIKETLDCRLYVCLCLSVIVF